MVTAGIGPACRNRLLQSNPVNRAKGKRLDSLLCSESAVIPRSRTAPALPVGSCPARSSLTRCLGDHRGLWPSQHNSLCSRRVQRRWHPRAQVCHQILTKTRGGQLKRCLSVSSRISCLSHRWMSLTSLDPCSAGGTLATLGSQPQCCHWNFSCTKLSDLSPPGMEAYPAHPAVRNALCSSI